MKNLFLYITVFVLVNSVYGQDSLSVYLGIAAKNNPTVLQRYHEYQAVLQKVPQVASLPDPQLEMGVFLTPMELIAGNQVADIKLMQMFPWFGVLKNAKDEMNLMAKMKFETFRDAKLQLMYELQQNWLELYRIRKDHQINAKNLDLLATIERLALVKYKVASAGGTSVAQKSPAVSISSMSGTGAAMGGSMSGSVKTDAASMSGVSSMGSSLASSGLANVYQIQSEKAELENTQSGLLEEEQLVVARFNALLNRPLTTVVVTPQVLSDEPLAILTDSALTHNPMLNMLAYEQQSLDARGRMQKQMGLPMVGVGLNYSVISKSEMSTSPMNGQDMLMPMLTVTLPIYRKKYNAMQTETKLLKAASEDNYKATANELQLSYRTALQQYHDAQRRLKLYGVQSSLAQKSLDIALKGFSAGSSSLSDILRLRQQLLDYEKKQVQALVDFNKAKAFVMRLKSGDNL